MDTLPITEEDRWLALTTREREVALLVARGKTNHDITAALKFSLKTYDTHRAHVLKKLNARHNVDICLVALRLGLVNAAGEQLAEVPVRERN